MQTFPRIFLASKSLRRKQLLSQIQMPFELLDVNIDETILSGEKPEAYAKRMALWKALRGFSEVKHQGIEDAVVISADTSIAIDRQILGKPKDFEDFKAMMHLFSGKTHRVLTSIYLVSYIHKEFALSTSEVTFKELSEEEIKQYWQTQEPLGKAGGYAIQGIGAAFIEKINGSYSGIMGLPLFELTQALQAFNITLFNLPKNMNNATEGNYQDNENNMMHYI